jgi:hypothetical protein
MPAYIESRQRLANMVAERWLKAYLKDDQWMHIKSGNSQDKYIKLKELGDNPDPDEVDKIIGNESWTRVQCDNCNGKFETAVWIGEKLYYESRTALVCLQCLNDAIDLYVKETNK